MYLVAVIVVAGALSAGLVSLTTTSTFTQLSQGNSEQARYMAMAGYEYAKKRLHENAPDIDIDEIADEDEGYSLGDHGSFKLKLGEIDNDLFAGRYEIVSEGIAYKGTSRQASYKIKGKFSPGFIDVPYAEMSEKEIENFIHHSAVKVPDDQNRDDWEPDSDPDNRVPDDVKVLRSSVGGSMLFVPVPATNDYNQYIVRAVVRNSEADSEGYAVFFDTELNDENKPDPGYSFNMDPDADELSIREWDDGERADEPETEVDPEKIEDFDYEDFYYIEIRVTGNSRAARATIYDLEDGANYDYTPKNIRNFKNDGPWNLDSDLSLSHSFSFDFDFTSEEQIYAGFKILGDEPVYFHHLEIELIHDDGQIIIIDDEGNRIEEEFSPILELPTDEHENWVELEIKSGVGTQEYDEFDFYAPEGITVESGVEFLSESAQGKVKLEADSGDINIEDGVVFSTTDSAGNDPEEIYIKTCGNVDIQGAQFDARRYIYIEAGGSINARDADLTVSTNSAQLGIDFVLNKECADIETGNIEVENLYMEFLNRDQQAEADPCEAIEGDLRDLSDNFDCP
ncbi:hypothetical protein [Desulfonatronospira thiodismutans]|nr:hypothetical protein [Desulfonatronospira thiodismutans]